MTTITFYICSVNHLTVIKECIQQKAVGQVIYNNK